MADLTSLSGLKAATQKNLVDFLRTDLETCSTFLDLAHTKVSIGHADAVGRLLGEAETGYETIARFAERVENPAQKAEIEEGLKVLRSRLDAMVG